MKRTIGLIAAMSLAAAALLVPTSAAAADATVWVLHGVPGATVDVCVNGGEVASNFEYEDSFSAMLPAGTYTASIHAANPGECAGALIKSKTVDVASGKNYTLAAGLNQGGKVRIFAFANKVGDMKDGVARIQVRHIAAAPQVDVWLNGAPAITNFANGEEVTARVPKGKYKVAVALKGTDTVVIGPYTFDLKPHTAYQIFATGTGDAGYILQVLAQPTDGGTV
jgi:hypothetical protein